MLLYPKALLMLIHFTLPLPVTLSPTSVISKKRKRSHETQIGRREELVVAITMKTRAKLRLEAPEG